MENRQVELPITSSFRTQESKESLEEEPVAHTAKMVPSSCSCTEGSRATVPPGAFSPSIHLKRLIMELSNYEVRAREWGSR